MGCGLTVAVVHLVAEHAQDTQRVLRLPGLRVDAEQHE